MPTRTTLVLTLSLALVLITGPAGAQSAGPLAGLPGQTATLLPDGRWLMIGGADASGPVGTVAVWDPRSAISRTVAALGYPRARHSATVLPDGTVVVIGGWGAGGVEPAVERIDPQFWIVEEVLNSPLTPRAEHTATLLTDGRVLVAGGIGADGALVADAEVWDPAGRTTEPVPLVTPRSGHTAELLSDGTVWLGGGQDAAGFALATGEWFDPDLVGFVAAASPPAEPDPAAGPHLTGSLPADGAIGVPVDTRIALRFSTPLAVETLHAQTVLVLGPGGLEAARVIPAEGGRLTFVTPDGPLAPGAVYRLSLHGPRDPAGEALPPTELHFSTAPAPGPGGTLPGAPAPEPPPGAAAVDPGVDWVPDRPTRWRTDWPPSPWQGMPPLEADPGVTALAGQVLRLQGQPLADVTLQIGPRATRTDATGRFLLTGLPAGRQVLLIDGRTASRPGQTYGIFHARVDVVDGQTTVLPYTIWMPRVDTAHAVTIASPTTTEVVVTTPLIPGLELHLPAGTVIHDHEHHPVTEVSLTPIPVDRPPFPLPPGVDIPVYFTIQPGGGHLQGWRDPAVPRAWLVYPNYRSDPLGARADFWSYDPEERGWHVYGHGAVIRDEQQIVPDPDTRLYEFTGAMYNTTGGPAKGPVPGGIPCCEPIDVGTGLFVLKKTDLFLPDVLPIALVRTYRPADGMVRPFGRGATHPYEMFLAGDASTYQWVDLILADGGRIHYVRTSPGTDAASAVFEHTATPTRFYKSRLAWNATWGGWDLTFTDGTVYAFREGFGATRPQQSALLRIQDRFGNVLTVQRDASATLTRIMSPNGRWISFTYDGNGRITQAQDNLGRVVTYTYDADSRLWKVTDPLGGVTEYTYDSAHRMLTLKDARGIVFLTNEYDTSDRVTRQTQADGTTYQLAYTTDGNGKITQTDVTDPRGFVERFTFNGDGYPLTRTRALGQPEQQALTYERQTGSNLVTAETDALSRRSAYVYDTMGNVTSVTRLAGTPDAVVTTYTYESTFNQVTSVTDPLNHTTTVGYDAQGRLTSITDPLNQQTVVTPNAAGQPTAIRDPLGNTTQFTYEAGDLASVTDPLGNPTKRFVDGAARLLAVSDPLGRLTRYTYDALNRLTQVTDPKGGVTSFTYDPNGNLLSVTDARNGVTSYTYDAMDRLATRTDPLLRQETYVYDTNGNLTQVTDRKNQVTTFAYDGLNRRTQATHADASTTSYTYDAGNRLTTITDSLAGTITRAHDGLDRLTQEMSPHGTVSYTYDAAGRRTGMTVAGQPAVGYTYDNGDRLTQIIQGSSTVAVAYDAANRRTSLTLPNGIVIESAYDTASRLTALTYKLGAATLGTLAYTYDGTGSRTQVGGTWARTGLPDPIDSAIYNAANQQLALGPRTMSYDLHGNLMTVTEAGATTTYAWDARNRLAGLSGPGLAASFGYDGLGRRRTKTIDGARTDFLYDGLNPVQEGVLPVTPAANLLTGFGIDEYLIRTDVVGARNLLTDALGSTLALTDPSGTVTTEYTYEPFGDTAVTGASNSNTFQFTGRESDGTGLYYYRARYYHPTLLRFISEDPLRLAADDVNLYPYVLNSPTMHGDPLGLWGTLILGGEAGLWMRPPHSWVQPRRLVNPELSRPPQQVKPVPTRPGPPRPTGEQLLDKSKHPAFREPMRFPRHLKPPENCLEGGTCTGTFPTGTFPIGGRKDPSPPPDTPPPCDVDMLGAYRCEA